MMNSNDQPPSPGSLDFQPRRANDKAMLSRLANVEKNLPVVKTTVEVIRSNYVTKGDLAIEVGKVNDRIAMVNENMAREFSNVHEKIAKVSENMAREFANVHEKIAKTNETMVREFSKANDFSVREFSKINEISVREFSKVNEFTVRETAKANENTSNLRAEMHGEFTRYTRRVIGAMIVICSSLTAAVYFIARNVH
ncbi:hypothetical protein [Pseudoduganella aquatica]|uniref:Chemotaxis protein n=1 Tax=Pseudoduganella aquatica TaxID=2660641 RepID=A0A7X4KLB9_9BURK|nr:hypothetical protein [Pseudoduganella aquatica]MYN06913.1 hypothetical protein [Pseudoduganella aquatica]